MYTASAEFYDLIYGTFKDYAAETAQIARLLRRHTPRCGTVLDVACGTGEHARRLAAEGFAVDGVDLDATLLAIARRKHPGGRFYQADMSAFDLPGRYDAVICLFSSIGYLRTIDRVAAAFRCFRDHLAPGGIVIVEPWLPPDALDRFRVGTTTGEANGVRVTRTSGVEVDGRASRLVFDYEISDGHGTRQAREVHELGLFTTPEMLQAFADAGLQADFDPEGLTNRGLYVARLAR